MSNKTNNKKRSPLTKIYIIAAIILVLILGGTFLYVKQVENGLLSDTFFNLRINKNIEDKSVKELITYTLPSGWSEDTNALHLGENGNVLLKSADYAGPFSGDSSKRSGASIILGASPKYLFIKGNYMIEIGPAILSEDVSTEIKDQYQKDIDSIINSIQFK